MVIYYAQGNYAIFELGTITGKLTQGQSYWTTTKKINATGNIITEHNLQ